MTVGGCVGWSTTTEDEIGSPAIAKPQPYNNGRGPTEVGRTGCGLKSALRQAALTKQYST